MDLKTLTDMFPSHKLVMGEQFAQESISALKVKAILNWSDTIFVNCDFSETRFHLLIISGAIFFKCDFSGASFRACDIDASEFISCNLTCTDLLASAVTDTSFTDCIIGGIMGPHDFTNCSFIYPRYSRRATIISTVPYVVVTTDATPYYIFKTDAGWRVHFGKKRITVECDKVDELEEPFKSAILYAKQVSQAQAAKLEKSLIE